MRLTPSTGALRIQVETDRGVRTYDKQRDGAIHVPDADARILIAEGVATRAGTAGPTAHLVGGFACRCGRRNYFRRCGSCGELAA